MKFGPVASHQAKGAIAAHSVRLNEGMIRKGAVITAHDIAALSASGITQIVVARLEDGDLDENNAAALLAGHVTGSGLRAEAAFTGRVNIFAQSAGILRANGALVTGINRIDEAITIATLPDYRAVVSGEMVATVKIIPYGVAAAAIRQAISVFHGVPPLHLAPYCKTQVGVISTLLPGLKPGIVDKTVKVMASRLASAAAIISADIRVSHDVALVADALQKRAASTDEMMIIFGASAISDRRDVIPAALAEAGGSVTHLGMPVDPGNLIMLGDIGGKPVIGAPGCARSPKENGFDWVLQRLLAGIHVSRLDIQAMGVGGLLMEIISRPQPRAIAALSAPNPVGVLILAAGRSLRMGEHNKLLQTLRGKPLIRHSTETALASQANTVTVVTGHEAAAIISALDGLDVQFVHNPDFATGMSSSVNAGLAALAPDADAALIMLGDMPNVTANLIDRILAAFHKRPETQAVIPTWLGQRGNPVLLARRVFAEVSNLKGDQGARRLLESMTENIIEIPLDDPAIMLDIDTPESLAALRAREVSAQ